MKVGQIYTNLRMGFDEFDRDEKIAKSRTLGFGSTLSGIVKNAFSFGLGQGFFQAVKRGFQVSVGAAVEFNKTLEQVDMAFTTMLGDAELAKSFIADISDFALRTPFEVSGLATSAKTMLGLGFAAGDVLPIIQSVGDATAALGTGQTGIDSIIMNLGRMKTQGKVTSRTMMYLAQTGIASWDMLADYMGKTTAEVQELVSKGLIPADVGIKALTEGMNTRFGGMMSKMEGTWQGVTSIIRGVWKMTLGAVTKDLFASTTQWLVKVKNFATGFYDALQVGGLSYAISQTLGEGFATGFGMISSAVTTVWGVIVGFANTIIRYWGTIRSATIAVAWAFTSFKLANFWLGLSAKTTGLFTKTLGILRGQALTTSATTGILATFVSTYNAQLAAASASGITHVGVLGLLRMGFTALQASLAPLIWPLLIIGAILGVGMTMWGKYQKAVQDAANKAQLEKMQESQKSYADSLSQVQMGLEGEEDALLSLGKAAKANVQSFDEVHQVGEDAAGSLGDMLSGLTDTGTLDTSSLIPELPEDLFDLSDGMNAAKLQIGGFWQWLGTGAKNTFASIGTWASGVWSGAVSAWGSFTAWVGGFWDSLKLAGGQVWNTLKTDVSNLWEGVKTTWGNFKSWVGGYWESLKTSASTTWTGIKEGVSTGWTMIREGISHQWDRLKTGADTVWAALKSSTGDVWNQIKSGTITSWENIKTGVITHATGLKTDLMKTWENMKTNAGTTWESMKVNASKTWEGVRNTLGGIWNGLKGRAETAWTVLKTTIADKWDDIKGDTDTKWEEIKEMLDSSWVDLKSRAVTAWDSLKSALSRGWESLKTSAQSWGQKIAEAFAGGISSGKPEVGAVMNNVAQQTADFIGFQSPTRKGPGRYADQWAPNLMRMYADGILRNMNLVQSATSTMASHMMPTVQMPIPTFTDIGSIRREGFVESGRSGFSSSDNSQQKELVLNLDGREIARLLLPAFEREYSRFGRRPAVRMG